MNKVEVKCECEGAGFITIADNGGDGVDLNQTTRMRR
jgi:hypothetical protein